MASAISSTYFGSDSNAHTHTFVFSTSSLSLDRKSALNSSDQSDSRLTLALLLGHYHVSLH
jgi:hypothetical protein